jgi:oligopeptide transport system permease protein
MIIPAVVLSILMLSFNLFGDGLRDALDPTMKEM